MPGLNIPIIETQCYEIQDINGKKESWYQLHHPLITKKICQASEREWENIGAVTGGAFQTEKKYKTNMPPTDQQ